MNEGVVGGQGRLGGGIKTALPRCHAVNVGEVS